MFEVIDPNLAKVPTVFDEPESVSAARVYADSLLKVVPPGEIDTVIDELASFDGDILRGTSELSAVLKSGAVGQEAKVELLKKGLEGKCLTYTRNTLCVLASNQRLDILSYIVERCRQLRQQQSGRRSIQVTSAVPLNDEQRRAVEQRLSELLATQAVLDLVVDPSLLGGLKVRVGDTVYDNSLRSRLNQLSHQLRQRSLHEIQCGRDRFGS
jgi:F-type H+-transporting ATPase subunit delta